MSPLGHNPALSLPLSVKPLPFNSVRIEVRQIPCYARPASVERMGKKAREIVTANIEVIKDLNTTYSDEWLAHYQYWLTAKWVRGIDANTLRPTLKE